MTVYIEKMKTKSSTVWFAGIVAIVIWGCSDSDCADVDWCEGNVVQGCRALSENDDHIAWGDASNRQAVPIQDCSLSEQLCVENSKGAACVWKDEPCPENTSAYCTDNTLNSCFAGYLANVSRCGDSEADTVCVEWNDNDTRDGTCAISATPCSDEAQSICADDRTLANCATGYPVFLVTCFGECVQIDSTRAACE